MAGPENRERISVIESSAIDSISDELISIINAFERVSMNDKNTTLSNSSNIETLYQQFNTIAQYFPQLLNNGEANIEPNVSNLPHIFQEINKLVENLKSLQNSSKALKDSIDSLGKDADFDSKVTIVDIKFRDNLWCIKVKSEERCTKNFRNVSIWVAETKEKIAEFLLIEPKVTLKQFLNVNLVPLHHLIAKIGERIVSRPCLIPKVKIIDVSYDESGQLVFTIENISNEVVENINIIDPNFYVISSTESLGKGEKSSLRSNYDIVKNTKFYVESNKVIISSYFESIVEDEADGNKVSEEIPLPEEVENPVIIDENQVVDDEYPVEDIIKQPPIIDFDFYREVELLDNEYKVIFANYFKDNYPSIPETEIINQVRIDTSFNWEVILERFRKMGLVE